LTAASRKVETKKGKRSRLFSTLYKKAKS